MSRRLFAAFAAATVLAAPVVATAAPPAPQITDPSGDAAGGQAALDIVSVRFSTTGTTSVTKVGKKKKVTYTPSKLVITETLGAAPSTTPGVRYRVEAEVAGCGQFDLYYVNGSDAPVGSLWYDCPEGTGPTDGGTLIDLLPKVSGSTLTWTIGLKALPAGTRAGATMSNFRAFTDVGDPVTGILGTGDGASNVLIFGDDPTSGVAVADVATGSGSWKVG